MKQFTLCLLALLLLPLSPRAQRPTAQEVKLFKTYFYDSLAVGMDFYTLAVINQKCERMERRKVRQQLAYKPFKKLKLKPELSLLTPKYESRYYNYGGIPNYEDSTVMRELVNLYWLIHASDERPLAYGLDLKRQRMKRYIRLFREQAKTLPLFYEIIDVAYGGDVDRYVDDIFDHSIFATSPNITRYRTYSLSSLRLRIDPLVIYSICCAQYVKPPKKQVNGRAVMPEELAAYNVSDRPMNDRELFKTYFMDSIWTKVDLITMNNIYTNKRMDDLVYHLWSSYRNDEWGVHFPPHTWWPNTFGDYFEREYTADSDSPENVRKYFEMLDDMFFRLRLGFKPERDKARMKRLIKDFRARATGPLPTFYQYIDSRFKGNSDAYVDYLFDNSLFTSEKKARSLKKWLKRTKLSRDPMVRYTLSVMQYLYCD